MEGADKLLWSVQVDHQLFALEKLDVTVSTSVNRSGREGVKTKTQKGRGSMTQLKNCWDYLRMTQSGSDCASAFCTHVSLPARG